MTPGEIMILGSNFTHAWYLGCTWGLLSASDQS